jgi:hypothetical protein
VILQCENDGFLSGDPSLQGPIFMVQLQQEIETFQFLVSHPKAQESLK